MMSNIRLEKRAWRINERLYITAKCKANTGSGCRRGGLAAANIDTTARHDYILAVANYVATVRILLRHRNMILYSEIPFVLHSKNSELLRLEKYKISPLPVVLLVTSTRFPESHLGNKSMAKN
jgi:hypothetical protein